MELSYGIAFWGGVISVFSPCVFPLIPSFYAQLVAFNQSGKTLHLMLNTIAFILGFTVVFVFLGANASFIGSMLFNYLGYIQRIGGLVIVLLGLSMMGIIQISFMSRGGRRYNGPKGLLGSFLLGIIIGSGWLPCVGPVLASILILSTNTATVAEGVKLLAIYSLGFAIPIVFTMLMMGKIIAIKSLNRYLPIIHKSSGVILVILGILVFFDYLSAISIWLGGFFLA